MFSKVDGQGVHISFCYTLTQLHESLLDAATFSSAIVTKKNNSFLLAKCPSELVDSVRPFTSIFVIVDWDVRKVVFLA